MVQAVSIDAHVIHELGHVGTLSGEHYFSGVVIKTDDRRAHLIAGTHRLSSACVDLLAEAKSGPQRSGARLLGEHRDRVVNVRCVPAQKLARALRWREEASGALCVAMRGTAAGGPKGVQDAKPPMKGPRPDEDLPCINEPLVADTLVLEKRGIVAQVGFRRQ